MQKTLEPAHSASPACAADLSIAHRAGSARIIQLKPCRPGPCLFLVPGTGGRIEGFADLARLIDGPMPVYAIEARGLDDTSEPDSNIDDMIAHYVEQIGAIQPAPPYFLLGHSFGGMVVYEMAQKLRAMKREVGGLILLDTVVPKRYWSRKFLLANLKGRLFDHIHRIFSNPISQSVKYYFRRFNLRARGLHQIPSDLKFGKDAARMLLANEMLLKKWEPKFYEGKLTLFMTSDMRELDSTWRARVGELEAHFIDGGHMGLIEWPNVKILAARISEFLARAAP